MIDFQQGYNILLFFKTYFMNSMLKECKMCTLLNSTSSFLLIFIRGPLYLSGLKHMLTDYNTWTYIPTDRETDWLTTKQGDSYIPLNFTCSGYKYMENLPSLYRLKSMDCACRMRTILCGSGPSVTFDLLHKNS